MEVSQGYGIVPVKVDEVQIRTFLRGRREPLATKGGKVNLLGVPCGNLNAIKFPALAPSGPETSLLLHACEFEGLTGSGP